MAKLRYCEFTGDKTSPWDGDKKEKCKHLGFYIQGNRRICMLSGETVGSDSEGWTTCTSSCETPVQVRSKYAKRVS